MRTYFDGYSLARESAEVESRKNKNIVIVTKSLVGGIRYCTCLPQDLADYDTFMDKFYKGEVVPFHFEIPKPEEKK